MNASNTSRTAASQRLMGRGALIAVAGIAVLAFANPMVVNGLTVLGFGLLLGGLLIVARFGR